MNSSSSGCISAPPEIMDNNIVCPYSKHHVVKKTRYYQHLLKCPKRAKALEEEHSVSNLNHPERSVITTENTPGLLGKGESAQVMFLDDTGDGKMLSSSKLQFFTKFTAKEKHVTVTDKVADWLKSVELDEDDVDDNWGTPWMGFEENLQRSTKPSYQTQKPDFTTPVPKYHRGSKAHFPSKKQGNYFHGKASEKSRTREWPKYDDGLRENFLEMDIISDIMKKPEFRN